MLMVAAITALYAKEERKEALVLSAVLVVLLVPVLLVRARNGDEVLGVLAVH